MTEILIFLIIPIIIILLAIAFSIRSKNFIYNKEHTEGKYMGLGMGIGILGTVVISIIIFFLTKGRFEYFYFSPAVGVALGAGIGASLEKKYGKKIKLTEKQKKIKWILAISGVGLLILGIAIFMLSYYLAK